MFNGKSTGVVVPCYNEERNLPKVLDTIPGFVDKIIVINDASKDKTLMIAKRYKKKLREKLIIIHHKKNKGVGGAIVHGYREAIKNKMELIAVMAGDAQMDPEDLPKLLLPASEGKADYIKGNRLLHKSVKQNMPHLRFFGNSLLTVLNKISTGYWKTMDPQCGYTVITNHALSTIPLKEIYPWYGVPNDILAKLNVFNFRVMDVVVNPIYGDEVSGIKLYKYIPKVSFLLLRKFIWRLKEKYIFRDFHPLVLFYLFGFLLTASGSIYAIFLLYSRFKFETISINAVLLCILLLIIGFQSIFFGMLFDMEYNKELNIS